MRGTRLALAFLIALALPAIRSSAAEGDDLAFRRSLDLIQADMKLRVLERLADRGFYVPQARSAAYREEQRALAAELDGAQRVDAEELRRWSAAAPAVREAEADA